MEIEDLTDLRSLLRSCNFNEEQIATLELARVVEEGDLMALTVEQLVEVCGVSRENAAKLLRRLGKRDVSVNAVAAEGNSSFVIHGNVVQTIVFNVEADGVALPVGRYPVELSFHNWCDIHFGRAATFVEPRLQTRKSCDISMESVIPMARRLKKPMIQLVGLPGMGRTSALAFFGRRLGALGFLPVYLDCSMFRESVSKVTADLRLCSRSQVLEFGHLFQPEAKRSLVLLLDNFVNFDVLSKYELAERLCIVAPVLFMQTLKGECTFELSGLERHFVASALHAAFGSYPPEAFEICCNLASNPRVLGLLSQVKCAPHLTEFGSLLKRESKVFDNAAAWACDSLGAFLPSDGQLCWVLGIGDSITFAQAADVLSMRFWDCWSLLGKPKLNHVGIARLMFRPKSIGIPRFVKFDILGRPRFVGSIANRIHGEEVRLGHPWCMGDHVYDSDSLYGSVDCPTRKWLLEMNVGHGKTGDMEELDLGVALKQLKVRNALDRRDGENASVALGASAGTRSVVGETSLENRLRDFMIQGSAALKSNTKLLRRGCTFFQRLRSWLFIICPGPLIFGCVFFFVLLPYSMNARSANVTFSMLVPFKDRDHMFAPLWEFSVEKLNGTYFFTFPSLSESEAVHALLSAPVGTHLSVGFCKFCNARPLHLYTEHSISGCLYSSPCHSSSTPIGILIFFAALCFTGVLCLLVAIVLCVWSCWKVREIEKRMAKEATNDEDVPLRDVSELL